MAATGRPSDILNLFPADPPRPTQKTNNKNQIVSFFQSKNLGGDEMMKAKAESRLSRRRVRRGNDLASTLWGCCGSRRETEEGVRVLESYI